MQNRYSSDNSDWNILKLINWTTSYFESHQVDSPRMTAEILLAHVLGLKRIDLYVKYDQPLNKDELAGFKSLIKRRIAREPVAYITGRKDFWTIELGVGRGVLIPRPDTESLVEAALESIGKRAGTDIHVLELGVGSGAVVLALASELPDVHFFGVDYSADALSHAVSNARRNDLGERVSFFNGFWFDAVKSESLFDVIVSNPPYIPSADIPDLQSEISLYEPVVALDGGADGLDSIRKIVGEAPCRLKSAGELLLEIGFDQGEAVAALANDSGEWRDVEIIRDYSGHDRVVRMTRRN